MPRSVPFWALSELLTWTKRVTSPCGGELLLAEGPGEEAAVVAPLLQVDQVGARDGRLGEDHGFPSVGQPSRLNRCLSVRRRTNWSPSKSFLPKPCSTILRCSSSMPVARLYWSLKSGRSW